VLWPSEPIELAPPESFRPEHCPWAPCPSRGSALRFRYRRHGSYRTRCQPLSIPRFLCLCCRRTFSRQSFSVTYYLKRPELSAQIAAALVAGSAHRPTARSLRCSPTTVTRRIARLGRHCLLLHSLVLGGLPTVSEPLVYDHFETFAHSQEEPCGLGTLVGHQSWFVYSLDFAPHRRTGRATPAQRIRQRRLFGSRPRGPDPYQAACREGFSVLLDHLPQRALPVHVDAHSSYPRALARAPLHGRFELIVHPNPRRGPKGSPRSRPARARDRALFPTDLMHGLLRHSLAHHRRETIAFGRRHNAVLERLFVFTVWRNLVKVRSERTLRSPTPAMSLGLASGPWTWERVLAKRLFFWRESIPRSWECIYRRQIDTRGLPFNARHSLKNAA
jgi:transposase-like protein